MARLYSAGISFLRVRSPDAPKITIAVGTTPRSLRTPSRRGLGGGSLARAISVASAAYGFAGTLGLDRVTAELVAQGGDHLGAVGVVLAGGEAHQERHRDHRCGHALVHGSLDCPAPLARVLHVTPNISPVGAFRLQGQCRQVEQPRAHHAAVLPDPGDVREFIVVLAGVKDLL